MKQKMLLDEVNDFNLEVRYPAYRKEFYKRCSAEFAQDCFNLAPEDTLSNPEVAAIIGQIHASLVPEHTWQG